eukprot:09289.XXX_89235_89351_1 [CDS] Oithona nana genome sequencing.
MYFLLILLTLRCLCWNRLGQSRSMPSVIEGDLDLVRLF